jgi:hypothetical protein
MVRKVVLCTVASALTCLGLASAAGAATRTQLVLDQSAAFSILGHSCGGIQEQVYATGFGPGGFPQGDVYMQTRCGGSGRGGGYHTTTYSAWATVTWDWVGGTRSFAPGGSAGSTEFFAEDAYGDRIYNLGTSAFLEATSPPIAAPAAPSGLSGSLSVIETPQETMLVRFQVGWTPAPETAALITSSTVTATPVGSSAPVLTTTVSGGSSSALVGGLVPYTTYRITVTSTDAEGTSEPSSPIELSSGGPEGEGGGGRSGAETCEQNQGTIKLSPGLEETPHVQRITVKGTLKGCDGPLNFSEGTYVAHLQTTEEVTCSTLVSISAAPTTSSVSLAVKWAPKEAGSSKGTLVMPLTEVPGVALGGTLEGGPLASPLSFSASSLSESFTGGPACGVASGKKKAKAVKSGTFASSSVQIGA